MSVLSAFNNIVIDFVDDCILVFPKDTYFKGYKQAIIILKKVNPRLISSSFKEYIEPYKKYIEEQNEDFFLKSNYDEFEKTEDVISAINRVKGYWNNSNLSQKNKEKIWEYVKILFTLSQKL
jgi:hypothetical protein